MVLKLIASVTILLIALNSYGLEDKSYAHGWYWGDDELVQKELKSQVTQKVVPPTFTQKEVLDNIRNEVEELKAKAVLNPTTENIASYIKSQNKITNLASGFSEGWQKTLLLNPELDYTAQNPTNNYARRLLNEKKQQDEKQYTSKFSSEYGLVFFFEGADSLSVYQSKMIKEFTINNNIPLVAVSMTGTPNQYFSNPEINKGQAEKMRVTVTPAVMAFHIKTKKVIPLVFGIITEHELMDRISSLYKRGY